MSANKNQSRLSEVLQLFLLPDYNVVSTTYLDLLLTHITTEGLQKGESESLKIIRKWMPDALQTWSTAAPCQAVTTFMLKLVGAISRDESRFLSWKNDNIHNRLCKVLNVRDESLPASIKMAYTSMLLDLIEHQSGRIWIIENGHWKDVLKFVQSNHTMYITRESHKFLYTLLSRESYNRKACEEIIMAISAPVIDATTESFDVPSIFEQVYADQNKLLCASLDLLTAILEHTLFVELDNPIPPLIEELTSLQSRVRALFEACISTQFIQHVNKLSLLLLFVKLRESITGSSETIVENEFKEFCTGLNYFCMMVLSKKLIVDFIKLNKVAMIYWKKSQMLRTFQMPSPHKFEHQAVVLIAVPLFISMKRYKAKEDLLEVFTDKMFDVTTTTVQRLAYTAKDILINGDISLEPICKLSIDQLLELCSIMDRDVAIIVFQTMCHVLVNYVPSCNSACNSQPLQPSQPKTPETPDSESVKAKHPRRRKVYKPLLDGDPITENPVLLLALLNGLNLMTEKFKLKWQECVETICVLSIANGILKHSGVETKICVQALKLARLAIQNFMPPNLALLVDRDEHHTNDIGPTLYTRIHDVNWEVRDSVLELLNTIAIISENKYPAFQDFIIRNGFLQISVDIAKNDGESYVRASALIFISTSIRINKLWDEKLSSLDLPQLAKKLIYEESEAIVRREAVIMMKELYVHRKWQKSTVDTMAVAMTAAAVLDLHWEVKVNALDFWKHFIQSHLTYQGMLDGSFPNVTFSKEHRKIVLLNDVEIKQRLHKALDELAKQRCLGVLLVTLEDNSDFEVSKTSAVIINDLKEILLKYKFNEPFPDVPSPKDSATMDCKYVKPSENNFINDALETARDSSNIIDEIVGDSDANLLASMYNNTMKMSCDKEKTGEETLGYISRVKKQDFLRKILKVNLNAYIDERSLWLQTHTTTFDSVLDDILTMHGKKDTNSMDCY